MNIPTDIQTVSVRSIVQFAHRYFEERVGCQLEQEKGSPEPLDPDAKEIT